ncbi:hypothetical protein JD844_012376, partial [Phrynosoma platyrhinos]
PQNQRDRLSALADGNGSSSYPVRVIEFLEEKKPVGLQLPAAFRPKFVKKAIGYRGGSSEAVLFSLHKRIMKDNTSPAFNSVWILVKQGCLGTAGVLTYGLICFKRGNTHQSQMMMRARILAQGFTVAALIVGVVVTALKPKK